MDGWMDGWMEKQIDRYIAYSRSRRDMTLPSNPPIVTT
jgi:hypothetical protein